MRSNLPCPYIVWLEGFEVQLHGTDVILVHCCLLSVGDSEDSSLIRDIPGEANGIFP